MDSLVSHSLHISSFLLVTFKRWPLLQCYSSFFHGFHVRLQNVHLVWHKCKYHSIHENVLCCNYQIMRWTEIQHKQFIEKSCHRSLSKVTIFKFPISFPMCRVRLFYSIFKWAFQCMRPPQVRKAPPVPKQASESVSVIEEEEEEIDDVEDDAAANDENVDTSKASTAAATTQRQPQGQGQEVERMSHHSYEEIAASEANSEVSRFGKGLCDEKVLKLDDDIFELFGILIFCKFWKDPHSPFWYRRKNCRIQRHSNSDCRSIRRACWPLDRHHGPGLGKKFCHHSLQKNLLIFRMYFKADIRIFLKVSTRSQGHKQILCNLTTYAQLMHSDWLKIVRWLILTNQSALFQCSIALLCQNLFMIMLMADLIKDLTAVNIRKWSNPASFVYFRFLTQILRKNCRLQRDSNSDRQRTDHLTTTTAPKNKCFWGNKSLKLKINPIKISWSWRRGNVKQIKTWNLGSLQLMNDASLSHSVSSKINHFKNPTHTCIIWNVLGLRCIYNMAHPREVSLYGWSPVYFVWIQLLCLYCMKNNFTCLVKSKPVKQEISHTVILPPMLSVLLPFPASFNLCLAFSSCIINR